MSRQQEQSCATTKESNKDSIITATANTIFENIALFFMTVFVLLCGSNTSSTPTEIQIHHLIFFPQQHKSLYGIIRNYSSKQDSRNQPLGITNHHNISQ